MSDWPVKIRFILSIKMSSRGEVPLSLDMSNFSVIVSTELAMEDAGENECLQDVSLAVMSTILVWRGSKRTGDVWKSGVLGIREFNIVDLEIGLPSVAGRRPCASRFGYRALMKHP